LALGAVLFFPRRCTKSPWIKMLGTGQKLVVLRV
jgi:hypothetical protein